MWLSACDYVQSAVRNMTRWCEPVEINIEQKRRLGIFLPLCRLMIILQSIKTQQLILRPPNPSLSHQHQSHYRWRETEPTSVAKITSSKHQQWQWTASNEHKPQIQQPRVAQAISEGFRVGVGCLGRLVCSFVEFDLVSGGVAEFGECADEVAWCGAKGVRSVEGGVATGDFGDEIIVSHQ